MGSAKPERGVVRDLHRSAPPTTMFKKLLLLFILVPLAELYLFMTLGAKIGILETVGIIVITGILGAWLTKAQGANALRRFQQASAEGRLPHKEVVDGLLILLAGAVLITPGFLTDAVGFLLLLPPVRALMRGSLANYLKSKITIVPPPSAGPPPSSHHHGKVIDVEVVDE
jgi:UPF0716 protein FxsA